METILIIEDYRDLRDVLRDLLELEGYRVITAGSGREALSTLSSERPTLIVMNLGLPDMSGLVLYETIQMTETLRRIPMIVMTGFTNIDINGVKMLYKPVQWSQLRNAIADVLEPAVQKLG